MGEGGWERVGGRGWVREGGWGDSQVGKGSGTKTDSILILIPQGEPRPGRGTPVRGEAEVLSSVDRVNRMPQKIEEMVVAALSQSPVAPPSLPSNRCGS